MSSKECKWEIFFCTHPRFKEQFANIDKELSDLFAENDEWGNLFLQHPIWFDMIFSKDNPGVAKFFSTRINWAKLFFPND